MFKPATIGYFKQVRNNPRCKASTDLLTGMAITIDEAKGLTLLPTAETAKGEVYIVSNIIDKPEIRRKEDFVVEKGEYVRADLVSDAKELPIELGADVIDGYDEISIGDMLVPSTTGKWEKATDVSGYDVSGYKVALEVVDKTAFSGKGLIAIVRA